MFTLLLTRGTIVWAEKKKLKTVQTEWAKKTYAYGSEDQCSGDYGLDTGKQV